jgi:hypothetical protein
MAIINRQNNLYAAEDWKVAYKAYSQVNFQAYDFDTIRSAMVDYIRVNFPENFNDYIESSEFIAIIELLAYLSQSLAFRMDINSRENFLETAERRDSVFRLARMLGYNPKRNIPASGLMKLVAVRTTEPLKDSLGNDLNNVNIFWDDANNADSYEQFITVLNAAMNVTNRFSTPTKSGKVNGIATDLYELNTQLVSPLAYTFQLSVNGINRQFQVVNPDFSDGKVFVERHPDPVNNFNLIYRNDGLGISSTNTGFFVMFKQGTLENQDFNYTVPVESRVQDITAQNINETDIFLQEVASTGGVLNKWTRIPNTVGQTLNYNDVVLGERNLYAVENLENSGIRLRFPDGNFGNIPYGLFRLYYRVSDPETFTLQPEDARNVRINIPYQNSQGTQFTLTLTVSLQESVANSLPPESLAAIKQRAPQVYYTQNRMVSAQDYNIFPFSQGTNITKLKAINKTHAGHSRYIDINDPTGTFQNLETFAQDGAIYTEMLNGSSSITISENNTTSEAISASLPLILKDTNLNNFIYEQYRRTWTATDTQKFDLSTRNAVWKTLPVVTGLSQTGYFEETTSVPGNISILVNSVGSGFEMFTENNFIKFVNPADQSEYNWVRITSVVNNGALSSGLTTATGPFRLSSAVQGGWVASEYIATMRKEFTAAEVSSIKQEMDNRRTFGLGYNPEIDNWYVIANADLAKTSEWSPNNANTTTGLGLDASWLVLFTMSPIDANNYRYLLSMRGQRYVVQSKNELKFYNINNVKVADSTNNSSKDLISFSTLNYKPGGSETFTWIDTTGNLRGDSWQSDETFSTYRSNIYDTGIPLRTRDTLWYDVEMEYVTNMGIYRNGNFNANVFVNSTSVSLSTYFADGTQGTTSTSNITIANNSGRISTWSANIVVSFSNNTFGFSILDPVTANVIYRDLNTTTGQFEIFQANAGGVTKSFGIDGITYNGTDGRIILSDLDTVTGSGNLVITKMFENNYTYVFDSTGRASQDKLVVRYRNNKNKLDQNIDWNIVSPIKFNDGYTDNRKVVVAAVDTDNDLVPDRPLQFREFVSERDLVFFEYYTDFDGYTYDRPLAGSIADYRNETVLDIDFSGDTIRAGSRTDTVQISSTDLLIVKNMSLVSNVVVGEAAISNASGLIVYDYTAKKIYQMQRSSTTMTALFLVETADYFVRNGRAAGQNTALIERDEVIFKWKHVAPKDVRIDPSISNIMEMLVLTNRYNDAVQKYKNVPGTPFPLPPTSAELSNEFAALSEFKTASDSLVYRSAEFKILFGSDADSENQARFRIVKLPSTTLSDNEIKARVVKAFDAFFNIENWEFGETFYFTELSSYVHQQLGNSIGSIVIIPKNSTGIFGDLFQIKAEPNQLFLHTAKVNDIEIVEKISSQTLRADR